MRLLIVGPPEDAVGVRVLEAAQARGHEVDRFDLAAVASSPMAFDGTQWMTAGPELSSYDAYVIRKFPPPVAPVEGATPAEWFSAALAQLERAHFAESCLLAIEAAGKPMVNPVARIAPYEKKPAQLAALGALGVPLPATLITNSRAAVAPFFAAHEQVIFKPVVGGAETRRLEALEQLPATLPAPVIFQERIVGPDIRVTVVDGEIVSAVEIPGDALDYRRGPDYAAGNQRYVDHPLPGPVARQCVAVADAFGHVLSGIDLKLGADGGYRFLEANSAPVYADIEAKTGAPISDHVVRCVERALRR